MIRLLSVQRFLLKWDMGISCLAVTPLSPGHTWPSLPSICSLAVQVHSCSVSGDLSSEVEDMSERWRSCKGCCVRESRSHIRFECHALNRPQLIFKVMFNNQFCVNKIL